MDDEDYQALHKNLTAGRRARNGHKETARRDYEDSIGHGTDKNNGINSDFWNNGINPDSYLSLPVSLLFFSNVRYLKSIR